MYARSLQNRYMYDFSKSMVLGIPSPTSSSVPTWSLFSSLHFAPQESPENNDHGMLSHKLTVYITPPPEGSGTIAEQGAERF